MNAVLAILRKDLMCFGVGGAAVNVCTNVCVYVCLNV